MLQVQVGDLRAVADLLGQVFQLVVGHVQGDQVAQLACTHIHKGTPTMTPFIHHKSIHSTIHLFIT